jgi:two-component system C4-dicarboxylate transport response regulator DctD
MSDTKKNYTVLVIDDDKEMRKSLAHLLESANWTVELASNSTGVETLLETLGADVILTDVRMPGRSGMQLLNDLVTHTHPPIVLMSAHGDIPMAVEAIQSGAYSFLEKPFDPIRLLTILDHAAEQHHLQQATLRLKERLADLTGLDRIFIGNSKLITKVKEQVLDLSGVSSTVLIQGETGTGKELVAKALHDLSPAVDAPFVAINCATIPIADFEEITFGTASGQAGILGRANNGTLFLDEITSAPIEVQAKLLRFLETKEYTPIGSDTPLSSELRIIAATNEPPSKAISENRLREDFYYRISGLTVNLPSLRDHKDDIPILFEHFSTQFARLYEVSPMVQSAEDISTLLSHQWPGNVRELRSVAERSVLASKRGYGGAAQILRSEEDLASPSQDLRNSVATFERTLISKAIHSHEGRMDDVADALGIGRRTLNEKIVKLNIDKDAIL